MVLRRMLPNTIRPLEKQMKRTKRQICNRKGPATDALERSLKRQWISIHEGSPPKRQRTSHVIPEYDFCEPLEQEPFPVIAWIFDD
jgi:hypothetical protein